MIFLVSSFLGFWLPQRRYQKERYCPKRLWFSGDLAHSLKSQYGLTMVELLVAVSIVAIGGAMAIPAVDRSSLNLSTASDNLIAEMRLARGTAVGQGVHFRIMLDAQSYTLQRLHGPDVNGAWNPDPAFPGRNVTLPPSISMVIEGDGVIEFNARGLIEPLPGEQVAEIETIVMNKSGSARTRTLKIWPSGQILEV